MILSLSDGSVIDFVVVVVGFVSDKTFVVAAATAWIMAF
jgi:hypothetical protein